MRCTSINSLFLQVLSNTRRNTCALKEGIRNLPDVKRAVYSHYFVSVQNTKSEPDHVLAIFFFAHCKHDPSAGQESRGSLIVGVIAMQTCCVPSRIAAAPLTCILESNEPASNDPTLVSSGSHMCGNGRHQEIRRKKQPEHSYKRTQHHKKIEEPPNNRCPPTASLLLIM